jgi:DNA helicase II / ATP-dependent DNA helicase PcrA
VGPEETGALRRNGYSGPSFFGPSADLSHPPRTVDRMEGPELLLEGLDERQREAVTSDAAPLAVLAGAGSGKTRVLTRRIAWRVATGAADAKHVLAVTFTRKAAGELVERLVALGVGPVTAGTLHSVALAQLRRRAGESGRDVPVVLARKARLLVPLIGGRGAAAAVAAADFAGEIEWAKARLVGPEQYVEAVERSDRETPRPAVEIAQVFEAYERQKRKRRVVDFDDLIVYCADAIERDEQFAASQRWRFRHLFVDEFQDVTPAQARLIRAWVGDRDDLCVVGDPDQAIYSFAGADPSQLTAFTRRFGGGAVVRLDANYRSTPEVVAAAEAVLADGGRPRPVRRAVRERGESPRVTAYDTDDLEAAGIAEAARRVHDNGVAWSQIGVLYRTNAQSVAFEEALTRAAIPFRVRGDARFLERPEVAAALERLKETARAAPGRGFTDQITDLEADAAEAPAHQREHVEALARLAREYTDIEGGTGSLDGFLAYLTIALRGDAPVSGGDAVELLTFHRAKGLEFHTVFVTGLERGLVPIARAETRDAREEERRLLYVALTRAEHSLHLTYAKERTLGSRTVRRARSPWLAPIESVLTPKSATGPAEPPARARIAAARSALAGARPVSDGAEPDPALLRELVDWRRNLARASGVPAYVIFHDSTLRALATERPENRESLLDVPGIGPVKAERHGDAVLALVRDRS